MTTKESTGATRGPATAMLLASPQLFEPTHATQAPNALPLTPGFLSKVVTADLRGREDIEAGRTRPMNAILHELGLDDLCR